MSDVWLCWYLVDRSAICVGRKQMAELTEKYDMPTRLPARESTAAAFTEACRTVHAYIDSDGAERLLTAIKAKSSKQAIQYAITREDGYKVAEYKYFPNRIDAQGQIVPGTARTKHVMRRGLELDLTEHAQAWIDKAESTMAERADLAPERYVAQHLRESIETVAVPLRAHANMWFAYDESIDLLRRCGQLLQEVVPNDHLFTLVPLGAGHETHMLAHSADLFLSKQLEDPVIRLSKILRLGEKMPHAKSVRMWHQLLPTVRLQCVQHERRLRQPLPKTVALLAQLQDLLEELPLRRQQPVRLVRAAG